jgi:hypothetical protein
MAQSVSKAEANVFAQARANVLALASSDVSTVRGALAKLAVLAQSSEGRAAILDESGANRVALLLSGTREGSVFGDSDVVAAAAGILCALLDHDCACFLFGWRRKRGRRTCVRVWTLVARAQRQSWR